MCESVRSERAFTSFLKTVGSENRRDAAAAAARSDQASRPTPYACKWLLSWFSQPARSTTNESNERRKLFPPPLPGYDASFALQSFAEMGSLLCPDLSSLSHRQQRYTTLARSNEISARRSAPSFSFVIAPGLVCRPLSGNISWILCTRPTKVGSYRLAESTRDRRRRGLSWKSSSPSPELRLKNVCASTSGKDLVYRDSNGHRDVPALFLSFSVPSYCLTCRWPPVASCDAVCCILRKFFFSFPARR